MKENLNYYLGVTINDKEKAKKKLELKRQLGSAVIIEGFINYYQERDSITAKRKIGLTSNLTDDPLLRDFIFLNNNRDDDRGSKLLYEAISGRNVYEQLLLSSIYRFSSSSKLVLDIIRKGGKIHDILQGISHMEKLNEGGIIYQFTFPLKKDGGVKKYLTDKLPNLIYTFLPTWGKYENKILIEATRELGSVFSIRKNVRKNGYMSVPNPFIAHQVLADMTFFHPDKLDKKSLCYMGKGSYETMRLMSIPAGQYIDKMPKTIAQIDAIRKVVDCSWLEWEHSSCEYNKYFEIKHGLKKGRIFHPTP